MHLRSPVAGQLRWRGVKRSWAPRGNPTITQTLLLPVAPPERLEDLRGLVHKAAWRSSPWCWAHGSDALVPRAWGYEPRTNMPRPGSRSVVAIGRTVSDESTPGRLRSIDQVHRLLTR
jgi:hypothetical protein